MSHAASSAPTKPPRVPVQADRGALAYAVAAGLGFLWAGAATCYILAHDDLAQWVTARQVDIRATYEDRIADLTARLEHQVTQNMVERTGFQRRADMLVLRQTEIEERQAWLRQLADRGGARHDPAGSDLAATALLPVRPPPRPPALGDAKPSPLPDALSFPLRNSSGQPAPTPEPTAVGPSPEPKPTDELRRVESSLDHIAVDELRLVEAFRREAHEEATRLRSAIAATGLDPERFGAAGAIGGPLVPLPASAKLQPFAALAAEAEARSAELLRLRSAARGLPLGKPVPGEADQTSSFGYRLDPFTRTMALHTGMDIRAETGTPVRATAAGRVVEADYSGGYGNMVEIDHGGGVTTRYGHLSAFAVAPGQRVELGQVIGRAGSTGRSTGPHVHYETRIGGEPVNPARFLQAARLLTLASRR